MLCKIIGEDACKVSQQLSEYESSQSKYKEESQPSRQFGQTQKLKLQELHKLRMSDALDRKAARDAENQDAQVLADSVLVSCRFVR